MSLGEQMADYPVNGMEVDQVDLCRYLYKLHFQLLMFLESFSKLLRLVSQSHTDITSDKSTEISLIENELRKVFKMSSVELEASISKKAEQYRGKVSCSGATGAVACQNLIPETAGN